ncbi:MAG: hydroxylamine oxidoreductase [Proteobacteria bacterium]|nr:hydroxylamine oxidoreductase [Pseudomonadota bacterium]
MAYANMVYIFLIILCISVWRWGFPLSGPYKSKEAALSAQSCIDCHEKLQPGILNDWRKSVHAKVGVDCIKCHQLETTASELAYMAHLNHTLVPISMVVSPKTCESCHPKEVKEYTSSKHANTIEIIWKIDKWMTDGMNNGIERTTGCFNCHGSVIDVMDGKPIPGTWPNVGVGRKNPDGSLGSCTSCHTRHKFSVAEARKPEACDQCHLGPDHPQIEIYNESKHGTIYHAESETWNFAPEDGKWLAGRDYRTPTCASCHMSQVRSQVENTHDVTQRLSWELQAPLTIRPEAFKPFPSGTSWEKERHKMGLVCMQCHSETWRNDHFDNLDKVVSHYNQTYYLPARQRMDELYEKGLLSTDVYFDENPEWEFYELWHYEGRRARMGTAMMAPDYAWWHGFYELKHRLIRFMAETDTLLENNQKAHVYSDFPGKKDKK